ncbi:MAG: PAS domain-containing protein [Acidobacteriaceae bacterium]|nr:PAS domain-containing protein [Acidobacteriaceae bacterium]
MIGAWAVVLAALPVSLIWLAPDLAPGTELSVVLKLLLVLAVAGACAMGLIYSWTRTWPKVAERLENFADALPALETQLIEEGPEEMQRLARAMKAMAERVRQVVERANLELSRRETILACMAEGVLAVDKNLKVIFCNEAFAQAFSTRIPIGEGRSLYEVVREPALRDILERVVRTRTQEKDRFQLPTAAGRSFEARALPIGEQPKQGAVIVLHDVTDIERQEQVRKDFVADVSHELRTPLAAIRGYAETLLDGAIEDGENNRKFLEIIHSHAVRLNNIASDLLVISELDSNVPPPVPPDRVPLLEVIESALHTVESAAAVRGVRVISEHCVDCSVMGYRFRLEQAVVNLLDNAVKFNRAGGSVTVECGPTEDGQVRITICDTGIGIPMEDLKRIFERFFRVDKARSRPAGGTGLGLSIVKEVVESMGGMVTVESQLGRGSKFSILLQAA